MNSNPIWLLLFQNVAVKLFWNKSAVMTRFHMKCYANGPRADL